MIIQHNPSYNMRILHVNKGHFKNENGIVLLANKLQATLVKSSDPIHFSEEWDIVNIPSGFISPELFPKAKKIIYGPNNFVFPSGIWLEKDYTSYPHVFYNTLSDWVTNLYEQKAQFSKHFNMITLPYLVDTERFKPTYPRHYEYDYLIYYKNVHPSRLEKAIQYCKDNNYTYTILQYGSYDEETYIRTLQVCKRCLWVGCHESQGFALLECLSMDVPIDIDDSKSMRCEWKGCEVYGEESIPEGHESTSSPYYASGWSEPRERVLELNSEWALKWVST